MERPNVGDKITLAKSYFDENIFITQYFPLLATDVVYEIINISELDEYWGVDKLKVVDTGDIIDISTVDELSDYWALIDETDVFRVIK